MKRVVGIFGLILLVLAGVGIVYRMNARGDDKALIRETLRQSLQASREGKPGGVFDALSKSLTVNNQEAEGNLGPIANFIRNQKPDLAVTNPNPIVTGDEATITSPVEIKTSLPIVGEHTYTVPDVVLTFRKETGREFIFFPAPKWRLVQVQAPGNIASLLGIP